MREPARRSRTTPQRGSPRAPNRIIIQEVYPTRGWIRATWRWFWHCPNHFKVLVAKTMLLLLGAAFGVDMSFMGFELGSDITGIGILDNVLLALEIPVEGLLTIAIAVRIFLSRKSIDKYRYI